MSSQAIALPIMDWQTLQTGHFTVFYPQSHEDKAWETLYYLEHYRSKVAKVVGHETPRTYIVLQDQGLQVNGYADPFRNQVSVFDVNTSSSGALITHESWLRVVSVHELTHRYQLDNAKGVNKTLTSLFGNIMSPNLSQPIGIIEGSAVYVESQLSPYEGRLNGGYFDALLLTKAKADALDHWAQANSLYAGFPYGQWYLYGSGFIQYLSRTYGQDRLAEYFNVSGEKTLSIGLGNIFPSFGPDAAAKEVYGMSLDALYKDWVTQLKTLSAGWNVPTAPPISTSRAFSKLALDSDSVFFLKETMDTVGPYETRWTSHLVRYDLSTGTSHNLTQFDTSFARIGMQKSDNALYFGLADIDDGYSNFDRSGYGQVASLIRYDLKSGHWEIVIKAPITAFSVNSNGTIRYTTEQKGRHGVQLWTWKNGHSTPEKRIDSLISEMIPWQDKHLIVYKAPLGSWNIGSLSNTGHVTPLFNTPWVESHIYRKENQIMFTSNPNGKVGLYIGNLDTLKRKRVNGPDYMEQGRWAGNALVYTSLLPESKGLFKGSLTLQEAPTSIPEVSQSRPDWKVLINTTTTPNTLITNAQSTLPTIRLLPFFAGGDMLNTTAYSLYLSPEETSYSIATRFFSPLTLSATQSDTSLDSTTTIAANYPVFRSSLSTIRSLSLTYDIAFTQDLYDINNDSEDFIPGLSMKTHNGPLDITWTGQWNLENQGSSFKITPIIYGENGQIKLSIRSTNNFDHNLSLRGQSSISAYQSTAASYHLDISHKLGHLRMGSWNPSVFLGDLYGTLFIDAHQFDGIDSPIDPRDVAFGGQLESELSLGKGLYMTPTFGLSYTYGDPFPLPFFTLSLSIAGL
ncbi:hypothetical protein HOH87_02200 [bacterium]|nr:hypothetical protein [bacterium]